MELPSLGSLPLIAEALGQRMNTRVTELVEARVYKSWGLVLTR